MDQQAMEAGRAAYMKGDFATAQAMLAAAKGPGEISGAADHMRGNALMKMGMYPEAARAYGEALQDRAYGKVGALSANRGRALLAAGDYDGAIASLDQALQDTGYQARYKAQMALGNAYERKGMMREAGAAYRAAAIDENNPNPSASLVKLGQCFMDLGRPIDAVEAFRTALDFSVPAAGQNAIYAQLGSAFVAASRMQEALDAFNHATADGTYQLSASEAAAQTAAQNAVAALVGTQPTGETDALLAAAGYGTGAFDPLDPLGKSGEFMPSPEDTGFFSVSEQEIMEDAKKRGKAQKKRKKKSVGKRIALIILVILVLLAACAGFLYFRGYGYPTQATVVENLFYAKNDDTDMSPYIASSVSDDDKAKIEAVLPNDSQVAIDSVDRAMSTSTVNATATLSSGGTQAYVISLVRDGIGWKVSDVKVSFDNTNASDSTTADSSSSKDSSAKDSSSSDSSSSDQSTDSGSTTADSGTTTTSGTTNP